MVHLTHVRDISPVNTPSDDFTYSVDFGVLLHIKIYAINSHLNNYCLHVHFVRLAPIFYWFVNFKALFDCFEVAPYHTSFYSVTTVDVRRCWTLTSAYRSFTNRQFFIKCVVIISALTSLFSHFPYARVSLNVQLVRDKQTALRTFITVVWIIYLFDVSFHPHVMSVAPIFDLFIYSIKLRAASVTCDKNIFVWWTTIVESR